MSFQVARSAFVEAVQKIGDEVVFLDLRFDSEMYPRPGQFVMAYTGGSEEIPLSVFDYKDGVLRLGIKAVGPSTRIFLGLRCGDYVSVRGPYGTYFRTDKAKRVLLASYGLGLVPLYFLARERKDKNLETEALPLLKEGDVILSELLNPLVSSVEVVMGNTEEMRYYEKLKTRLEEARYDLVVSCGYKTFVYRVWKICEEVGVPSQASLERLMKCGIGLCGSCLIDGEDRAIRLCVEGPVLPSDVLKKLRDFGCHEYDQTGRKVRI
ncbi:MAG: hypothetical protein ACE5GD_03240 [Candidatus Geothermarchaeales archaeon]